MKIVVLTIIALLICVVLLGVKVLFIKGAKFPSGHVGSSPQLRAKGLGCASDPDQSANRKKSKSH